MSELANCPNCGGIFVKTRFRDVCEKCFKQEEEDFETVYAFIRKRENRTATIPEVVEATGVSEELIIKFIKTGRLTLAQLPNINYPCTRCGGPTREGDLCKKCAEQLRRDLKTHESEQVHRQQVAEQEKKERQITYYAIDERHRRRGR